MGVRVNTTVAQESIVSHTGAGAPTRVLGQPLFDGIIAEGKRILIVDDVVTFGSTLANLRGFIHHCGSTVVGASTLSAGHGGTKLALPDHVKELLSVNHVCEDGAERCDEGHDRGRQTHPSDLAAGRQRLLHLCNAFFKRLADRPSVHACRFLEQ